MAMLRVLVLFQIFFASLHPLRLCVKTTFIIFAFEFSHDSASRWPRVTKPEL